MKLPEYHEKHGSAATARKMVDRHISNLCGIGIDDLCDTYEMGDLVDTVAEILDEKDYAAARALVNDTITMEFLEENEFGC